MFSARAAISGSCLLIDQPGYVARDRRLRHDESGAVVTDIIQQNLPRRSIQFSAVFSQPFGRQNLRFNGCSVPQRMIWFAGDKCSGAVTVTGR